MTIQQYATLISLVMPLLVFLSGIGSHFLFARMTPQQHQVVQEIASMVVPAVEKTCSLLSGESKRQEATRLIVEILASMGVKSVSIALISTAIEASVYALNQSIMTAQTTKLPVVTPPQK